MKIKAVTIATLLLIVAGCNISIPKKYVRAKQQQRPIKVCVLNDYKNPVSEEKITRAFESASVLFPSEVIVQYCHHGTFYGDYNVEAQALGAFARSRCRDAEFTAVFTNTKMRVKDVPELLGGDEDNELCGVACMDERAMVVFNFEQNLYQRNGNDWFSWTIITIAHEIAHLMLVDHSLFTASIMYPYVNVTKGNFLAEDVQRLRAFLLFGRRHSRRHLGFL
jgi:hypothetical protein